MHGKGTFYFTDGRKYVTVSTVFAGAATAATAAEVARVAAFLCCCDEPCLCPAVAQKTHASTVHFKWQGK